MKKNIFLIFISTIFFNIITAQAQNTTFSEIANLMQESTKEITNTCYDSSVDISNSKITISFTSKNNNPECTKFQNYLKDWNLEFYDDDKVAIFNANKKIYENDIVDENILELSNVWIEKFVSIISTLRNISTPISKDKEGIFTSNIARYIVTRINYTSDDDYPCTTETCLGPAIAQNHIYTFLMIKYADYEDFNLDYITPNSITVNYKPLLTVSEFQMMNLYKLNNQNKTFEQIYLTNNYNLSPWGSYMDQNLNSNTTYKYVLIKNLVDGKDTLTEEEMNNILNDDKYEVFILEGTTLKEPNINEETKPDTTIEESEPTENPNDIENPKTGTKIEIYVIALIISLFLVYLAIYKKTKIFKI